ncbi:hypothetical protein [Kineococcus sp. SYSU DK006]|uniref:hypothetical protein n=1 Tax=Kineococcus sp. SYSU DK006 TaxID=3383127 RepID=UPI003D7CDA68
MKRAHLAHILRAASQIAADPDVVVIGSQSILGSFDEDGLPDPVIGSVEADVAFWDDPDNCKSDAVDGAIGEDSDFHRMNGYYAQGVSGAPRSCPRAGASESSCGRAGPARRGGRTAWRRTTSRSPSSSQHA